MELDFRPVVVFWASLALGLIALETVVPGVALLWLGLAAGVMLLLVVFVPDLPIFWQAVIFIAMAFLTVVVYWKVIRKTGIATTRPLLNRRAEQLVGQVHALDQAIVNGRGRIRIGDTYWQVEGPDLAQGSRVRIIAADTMVLKVDLA